MSTIAPVRSASDRAAFLRFPWKIYANYPQWVPPILSQQKRELDPEVGWFFNDGFGSKAEFFLARKGGEVTGRIAAIRNERHLRQHDDDVGFFGFFECIDDPAVAASLLGAAEDWLHGEGLEVSRGPVSFTLNDPAGVTIEGGDLRPSIRVAFTPPYYADLLEACGYRKIRDLLGYRLPIRELADHLQKYQKAFAPAETGDLVSRPLNRRDLERDATIGAELFSEAWRGNWGSFPVLPEDLLRGLREMGPFFDERLVRLALSRDKPVGMLVTVADPWEVLHRLDGKLGVKGLWKVMRERKHISRLRVLLLGVLPGYNASQIGPLLFQEILKIPEEFPAVRLLDLTWILEDNLPTRELAEAMGAERAQVLRIFEKFF